MLAHFLTDEIFICCLRISNEYDLKLSKSCVYQDGVMLPSESILYLAPFSDQDYENR